MEKLLPLLCCSRVINPFRVCGTWAELTMCNLVVIFRNDYNYMRIKDISKENRPRERFLKAGASSLSDADLLAVILQKGTKEENVIELICQIV